MRIVWEVEDGYIGKSRPQRTIIDDDELAELETEDERDEFIEQYVQDDFERRISFTITGKYDD